MFSAQKTVLKIIKKMMFIKQNKYNFMIADNRVANQIENE